MELIKKRKENEKNPKKTMNAPKTDSKKNNEFNNPNRKILNNKKQIFEKEAQKNILDILNRPSNNLNYTKKIQKTNNKVNLSNIDNNKQKLFNLNKNNINLNEKSNPICTINRKNTFKKIIRKNSEIPFNKKINNIKNQKNRNLISERILNKDKNFEIKRNHTANSREMLKNKSKINEKEKSNDKIINEIKKLNRDQINKFSIFHFFKSDNIFIFIKNSKNSEIKPNKYFEIILDFELPQAYRPRMNFFGNIPKCIIETCNNGNIFMIKNFNNCNIIWKLLHPDKMRLLIRNLYPYQKFNHFPCTYQLGRKDNLYKHYKQFKRIAPELYNYIPPTYILPLDTENFEIELKKNKKYIWIVKPVNLSRGRGIHLLRGEEEYKKLYKNNRNKDTKDSNLQLLISRYLENPHLLNNKKYDLRIYVLVGSFTPLKIYLYYNGLVRFATEDYQKDNYDNVFIHLTNYSINKKNPNYKSNLKNNKEIDDLNEVEEEEEEESKQEDDSSKWSLVEYRNYFKKDLNSFERIWKQIEDIVIKTILTVFEYNCREMSGNKNNNLFELYGFDIFIDESLRPWLLEVNVNPSLHCTSPLDLSIKTDLITDVFNLVGISPFNHNNNEEIYKFSNKKKKFNNKKNEEIKLPTIGGLGKNNKNSNLINNKLKIEKNFNPNNLKLKMPEYDDEYYKNMITMFNEEKLRAETTGFSLIFPKKENIELYANILNKSNFVNDSNIVLWEYILN